VRERCEWNVYDQVEIVDGQIFVTNFKYSRGTYPLASGDLYVHPKSKKLMQVPLKKRKRYAPNELIHKDVGNVRYTMDTLKYNRKIKPGVFEEVVEKVWMRTTRVEFEDFRYQNDTSRGLQIYEQTGRKYYPQIRVPFTNVRWEKRTASKKEIKQHNLKELEK
jgi:hypothetical protein